MLQTGVYQLILLPLTPVLRTRIDARAMATLWLIPNMLYLTFHLFRWLSPAIVIPVDSRWILILLAVWVGGSVLVFLWYVISHLRFRR